MSRKSAWAHQSRRPRKSARLDRLPRCPRERSLIRFSGVFPQPARQRGSDQQAEEHREGRPDRKDLDDGNDQHDIPLRAKFGSPTSCIQPPARCMSYAAWCCPFRLAFRRCRSIETFSPNTLAPALRPPTIVALCGGPPKQIGPIFRPGRCSRSIRCNASHDPAEVRIDGAAHGRFNPAAFDADVAERAIVEFVQCLDGLAAREMVDDVRLPICRAGGKSRPSRHWALITGWPAVLDIVVIALLLAFRRPSLSRRCKRLRERLHPDGPIVLHPSQCNLWLDGS